MWNHFRLGRLLASRTGRRHPRYTRHFPGSFHRPWLVVGAAVVVLTVAGIISLAIAASPGNPSALAASHKF